MTDLQFRMLGPLEVLRGASAVPLPPGRPRALLAVLIVHLNEVLSVDRLIEELWRGDPPASATHALQVYVSNLRKLLDPERPPGTRAAVLVTRAPGYGLQGPPECCDARRFETLVADGCRALDESRPLDAVRVLDEALGLWRGPVLADLGDEPFVQTATIRLEELRLDATEARIEAHLAVGRHHQLIGELEALVHRHPFREHLWAQLMVTLYRSGRQADALRTFQRLRTVLGEELGLEPSPELRELEAAVLRHDPTLAAPLADGLATSQVITFLLTDIEASTPHWETHPEAMAAAVARHDALAAAVVAAHGGRLLKARGEGDSTFSVFDRASAAVDAAWALHQALVTEAWPTSPPLAVRIAVHTGEAEVREGDYFGRAVNRAARLRSVAEGGQVVLSRTTADLVADDIPDGAALVDLGDRALRGLRRPEHVFALETTRRRPAPGSAPPDGEAPVAASQLPLPQLLTETGPIFVGRQRELERLERTWKEAAAGVLRVGLVAGEPGVGKTRLVAEVAARIHADGATVLAGRCDEDLGVPYQPFVEALGHYVDHTPVGELSRTVGRFGGELVRLVPQLAARLSDLPSPLRSDPETERYRLFTAVADWVAAASVDHPVLLVLDDLQWAGKPTLLLLRHVARSTSPSRALVLGTFRDTELGADHPLVELLADLRRQAGVERIALSGLDEGDVIAFVEQSATDLGGDRIALARAIHQESEGNPFFVRQLLRHLAETPAGCRSPADGESNPPLTGLDVPEGVREVVTRRLARLSPASNRALQVAAVVGTEFDPALLEEDGGGQTELISALEEAMAARLVEEGAEGRYRFVHAIVRHTLYDGLSALRRAALHSRVAAAIETRHGAAIDDHLPALTHHFVRAGADAAKVVDYATRAGERAMAQLAFEAAAAHYEQALTALEAKPADTAARAVVLLGLARARARAGDTRAAETFVTAAEAARVGHDAETLAGAALGLADLWAFSASIDETRIDLLEEARRALGGSVSSVTAHLLARLATELYAVPGSWDRREQLSAGSIAVARRLGDPLTLALSLHARNYTLWGPGGTDERLALGREIIDLAHEGADPELALQGHAWCQIALLELGDVAGLDRELADYARLAEELRQPRYRWYACSRLGMRALLEGDYDRGECLIRRAWEIGRQAGEPDAENVFGTQMFLVWQERPSPEGHEVFDRICAVAGATLPPDSVLVLGVRLMRLFLLLDTERGQEARADLERLLDFGIGKLDHSFYGMSWSIFAVLLAAAADRLAALEPSATLYDLLLPYAGLNVQNCGAISFDGSYSHHLGVLAAMLERWDAAEEHWAEAAAMHERMGAHAYLARTRLEWARMLLARRRRRDVGRAEELLAQAAETAGALRLETLRRRAQGLVH